MSEAHSSVMGGSTCARRIQCPGSLKLEQNAPDTAGDAARQGTVFHDAMEYLLNNEDVPETSVIGQDFGQAEEGEGDKWQITEAQFEEKVAPALAAWDQIITTYDLVDWKVEQSVSLIEWIEGAHGRGDVFGISRDRKTLVVLDWKFGDGVMVDPRENYQFAFYAAGALYDPSEEMYEFTQHVEEIVFVVVQPTVRKTAIWDQWETTIEWVDSIMNRAREAVKIGLSDAPTFKAGKECGFCKGRVACPELNGAATMALKTEPGTVPAAELADKLDMLKPLEAWIKAVRKRAHDEASRGVVIPSYKLIQGTKSRNWTDDALAESYLKRKRLKIKERYTQKLISPAKLEELKPKLYKDDETQELINHGRGNPRLVKDDHPEAAIVDTMKMVADALPPAPQANDGE